MLNLCQFILIHTFPYSKEYSTEIIFPGNLPAFLTGTKGIFNLSATIGPNKKPRDSTPAMISGFGVACLTCSQSMSIRSCSALGLRKMGKMSLSKKQL